MKIFPTTLLDDMAAQATASARGRAHHNIHASASDLVQRFLVVADRRTYFRPHRHLVKSELATLLRGSFDILLFEGILRTRALSEVLSGTLQVRLQVYAYSAFIPGRQPKAISKINGTGLIAPTF